MRAGRGLTTGFAVLEYLVLFLVIVGALIGFRGYLQRGVQGQFRKAGESYGMLQQYNPGASIDCAYDDKQGVWFSQECFDHLSYQRDCGTFQGYANMDACVDATRVACHVSTCLIPGLTP